MRIHSKFGNIVFFNIFNYDIIWFILNIWPRYLFLIHHLIIGRLFDLRTALNCLSTEFIFHLILSLLLQCLSAFDFIYSFHLEILLLLLKGLYLLFEFVYDFQDSHFVLVDLLDLVSVVHLILFGIHLPCGTVVVQKLLCVLQECFLPDAHIFDIFNLILIFTDINLIFISLFFLPASPPVLLWANLFQYDLLSRQFSPLCKLEYFVHQVLFQGLILDVIHFNHELINLLKVLFICLHAFVLDDILQYCISC